MSKIKTLAALAAILVVVSAGTGIVGATIVDTYVDTSVQEDETILAESEWTTSANASTDSVTVNIIENGTTTVVNSTVLNADPGNWTSHEFTNASELNGSYDVEFNATNATVVNQTNIDVLTTTSGGVTSDTFLSDVESFLGGVSPTSALAVIFAAVGVGLFLREY